MDRRVFFDRIRQSIFNGRLSQRQVDGINALLDALARHGVTEPAPAGSVFGNVHRETGGRMEPVRETFADSDAEAVRRLEAAWASGQLRKRGVRTPYWRQTINGRPNIGRGLIQLTHPENFRKLGRALGLPLDKEPELAMQLAVSASIAVVGMRDGLFRKGHDLARYFPADGAPDFRGARAIVNGDVNVRSGKRTVGTEVADLSAAYAAAIRAAGGISSAAFPNPKPGQAQGGAGKPADGRSVTSKGITAGGAILAVLTALAALAAWWVGIRP